jgi:hypothetical protein
MYPAPDASNSATEVVDFYQKHLIGIRIGMVLGLLSVGLIAPFGAAIAARTRRTEQGTPIWTYAQLLCAGAGVAVSALPFLMWAAAAFRPGTVSADITLTMNDLGWITFLLPVPPFMVWCVAIAIPIYKNESGIPLFPRWVAHYNLLSAMGFAPCLLMQFTKLGPFAYHGVAVNYIPLAGLAAWVGVMTAALIKAINQDDTEISGGSTVNRSERALVSSRGRQ